MRAGTAAEATAPAPSRARRGEPCAAFLGGATRFATIALQPASPGAKVPELAGEAVKYTPLVTKDGRELIWTGDRFAVLGQKDLEQMSLPPLQRSMAKLAQWQQSAVDAFFPSPDAVTDDYWPYARWKAQHRVFSSMLSILSTQAMLQAVGVGAQRSLPAAATLNWVLKDGLGRLGRISVGALFGSGFDSDLKRCRFQSSVLYSSCIFLEMMTPFFPQHFLALATSAMVGKSIGLTTHVATQPAFHKSFACGETMAEISAKTQAQCVVMDNVGLALVVVIRRLLGNNAALNKALPLLLFPLLTIGDLHAINRELKSVELKTMNVERAEIIAHNWVCKREVPSTRQVSNTEQLFSAPSVADGNYPLRLSPILSLASSPAELEKLLQFYERKNYIMRCPREVGANEEVASAHKAPIVLALDQQATSRDILFAILHAAYARKLRLEQPSDDDRQKILRDSLQATERDFAGFEKSVRETGWQMHPFMLSGNEKKHCQYVRLR
eukprot:jgi/Tetstr1/424191/TSEL_014797.t1